MSTLIGSARGQVTLPKDLLRHLGVRPGEKIVVEKRPGCLIVMTAARPAGDISDVFDFLKRRKGPSLSIEETNRVVTRGRPGKR